MPPRPVPPFSPVLFAGLALAPLPTAPLEVALGLVLRRLHARRPGLFARVAGLGERALLIDPVDLPFSIVLRPGAEPPRLSVVSGDGEGEGEGVCAAVRGPLLTLLDLARGRLDGDALFFARALAVEGDTEVVVALRNALDSAGTDLLDETLAALAPAEAPLRWALAAVRAVHGRLAADLASVQAALLAPVAGETARLEARVQALEAVPLRRMPARPPVVAR